MSYTTDQIKQLVIDAANRYGIDANVALAQIAQESGFNPNATGPPTRYGTAKGIAQFIDGTWGQYGSGSPYDPAAAADAYGRYMRDLLARYSGDYTKALAAYNAGPGNVDKYDGVPPFAQTQDYVKRILSGITSIFGSDGGNDGASTDNSSELTGVNLPLLIGIAVIAYLLLS